MKFSFELTFRPRVFICKERATGRTAIVSAKTQYEAFVMAIDHMSLNSQDVSEFPTDSVGVMLLNEEEEM